MRFLFRRFTIPVNLHGHVVVYRPPLGSPDGPKCFPPNDEAFCALCDNGFFKLDSPFQYVGVKWQRLVDRSVKVIHETGSCGLGSFDAELVLTFECDVNAEYPARTDVDVANALQVKGFRITRNNSHTDDAVVFIGMLRVTNVRVDSEFGTVRSYELSDEDWRE